MPVRYKSDHPAEVTKSRLPRHGKKCQNNRKKYEKRHASYISYHTEKRKWKQYMERRVLRFWSGR